MHRLFFKILSQNQDSVQRCNDRTNPFHSANRNWMIKQEIDIDEN